MIATATHDTKRGEDARARLNALSEVPAEWQEALATWREIVGPRLGTAEDGPAPDVNDQYMLLQALLAAWPLELLDSDDSGAIGSFRERFKGFAEKALREAKRHTSWVNNNQAYERAVSSLIDILLAPGSEFLAAFRPLARRLAHAGMLTGLARTVLKTTLPGVPDIYQGTEFWDVSLVDPDNRRPVDYDARAAALDEQASTETLLGTWTDGRVKQRILTRMLADRAASPGLYADGDYRPIEARGEGAANVLAFGRRAGDEELVVATPRLVAALAGGEDLPLGDVWGETRLPVPAGRWRDLLGGSEIESGGDGVPVRELFARLPVSVLRRVG
jgi:(1->4)-alpha-D-glucan 1-alpha-D-glucosylmutase